MIDRQEIQNHLNVVLSHTPADAGFIELRSFNDKRKGDAAGQLFVPANATAQEIDQAVEWAASESANGRGVFISYNPRKVADGSKQSVAQMTAIYTDLDLEKKGITREAALERVKAAPIQPELIIDSGRGLHLIHFFAPTKDKVEWTAAQRKLYEFYQDFGADRAIVTDESRVLRMSGCPNQKDETPRATSIVRFTPQALAFYDVKTGYNVTATDLVAKVGKRDLPDVIEEGVPTADYEGRNDLLFREGCALRDRGYMRPEIQAVLEAMNEVRCQPPLDISELERIVDQVVDYDPKHQLSVITQDDIDALTHTFGKFMTFAYPNVEPVLFGLYPGEVGMVQAKPNVGKTTMMLNMAMCAATGRAYAPVIAEGAPKKVIYLDFENRAVFLQQDLMRMAHFNFDEYEQQLLADNLSIGVDKMIGDQPFSLSNETHMAMFIKKAEDFCADIIVIDTLAQAFALTNENDNSEMQRAVVSPLQQLARKTGASILLVHHIGKNGENGDSSKLYRGRGASSLAGACRLILDLDHIKDAERNIVKGMVLLHCAKVKGAQFDDVTYRLDFERRWFEAAEGDFAVPSTEAKFDRLINLVVAPMTRADIIGAATLAGIDASESTIERALKLAVSTGLLKRAGSGRGRYSHYEPTPILLERVGLLPAGSTIEPQALPAADDTVIEVEGMDVRDVTDEEPKENLVQFPKRERAKAKVVNGGDIETDEDDGVEI